MESNFEMWQNGKSYMYILIGKMYDDSKNLLADFTKVFYNSQNAFDYAMDKFSRIIAHSKAYIYQIPFVFAKDYHSEVSIYDNAETIVNELKPMYEIKHDEHHTLIF